MSIDRLLRKEEQWWEETRSTKRVAFTADGTLCAYNLDDIKPILDAHYPFDDGKWYFNETRDREIANTAGDVVYCNPQVFWQHTQTQPSTFEYK